MTPPERLVPDRRSRDICSLLGGRDDKYSLYSTGNLAYHARSREEDGSAGFRGTCAYLTHNFSGVMAVSLSKDGRPLGFAQTSFTWYPDRIHRSWKAEEALELEEDRCILDDTLVDLIRISNLASSTVQVELVVGGEIGRHDEQVRAAVDDSDSGVPGFDTLAPGRHPLVLAHDRRLRLCRILAIGRADGEAPEGTHSDGTRSRYGLAKRIRFDPAETRTLVAALHVCADEPAAIRRGYDALHRILSQPDSALDRVRQQWNRFFNDEIPRFECSDPYYEALYYYRWYSLHGKMLFPAPGGFAHPACREGTAFANAVIPFSAALAMLDLRWMRDPSWAYGTARVMFENMNDGHMANHIYVDRIDGDVNNRDSTGADFPYHNYATWALWQTYLVHPKPAILEELYPRLAQNVAFYDRLLDVDGDGLYETYPWGSLSGMEWMSRFLYLHPLEALRVIPPWGFGYQYRPDETTERQDIEWSRKIEQAVVFSPRITLPHDGKGIRKLYYGDTLYYRQETVDLNSFVFLEFRAIAEIARLLGRHSESEFYSARAKRTAKAVAERMWDEEDRFFYDLDPLTHEKARVMTPVGFYPFFAEFAGLEHARIFDHLFDARKFWTAFPVPTITMDYPRLRKLRECGWVYWNYGSWPMTTSHACDAVAKAGKRAAEAKHPEASRLLRGAAELFDRYVRTHFMDGDLKKIEILEWYDPHQGKKTGGPGPLGQDYCHSFFIDLLVRHLVGFDPVPCAAEGETVRLRPLPTKLESFRLSGIRYRGKDITVAYAKSGAERAGEAPGYDLFVDGVRVARRPELGDLDVELA